MSMNYAEVGKHLEALMEKIGEPLSPMQTLALTGAVAVWLEKARMQGQGDIYGVLRTAANGEQTRGRP